jgi:ribosome-associated protein
MTRPDDVETITITSDMIRLGQLLKFADVAESGAQAGALVTSGDVQVDDGAVVTVALPGGASVPRVVTGDDVDVPW